jgi:excisionase family DNA binding protein
MAQDVPFGEQLLTVTEVASNLRVPVTWVYERTRRSGSDQIPHFKLGKYLRFHWSAVQKWLENMKRQ